MHVQALPATHWILPWICAWRVLQLSSSCPCRRRMLENLPSSQTLNQERNPLTLSWPWQEHLLRKPLDLISKAGQFHYLQRSFCFEPALSSKLYWNWKHPPIQIDNVFELFESCTTHSWNRNSEGMSNSHHKRLVLHWEVVVSQHELSIFIHTGLGVQWSWRPLSVGQSPWSLKTVESWA